MGNGGGTMNLSDLLKKASPRPWFSYRYGHFYGFNIAVTRPKTCKRRIFECHAVIEIPPERLEADMKLIETAVNNFERMREALMKIAEFDGGCECEEEICVFAIAKEALKEVGDL
jgi:hypothetical protein